MLILFVIIFLYAQIIAFLATNVNNFITIFHFYLTGFISVVFLTINLKLYYIIKTAAAFCISFGSGLIFISLIKLFHFSNKKSDLLSAFLTVQVSRLHTAFKYVKIQVLKRRLYRFCFAVFRLVVRHYSDNDFIVTMIQV